VPCSRDCVQVEVFLEARALKSRCASKNTALEGCIRLGPACMLTGCTLEETENV
jgi:hypothetical protein